MAGLKEKTKNKKAMGSGNPTIKFELDMEESKQPDTVINAFDVLHGKFLEKPKPAIYRPKPVKGQLTKEWYDF